MASVHVRGQRKPHAGPQQERVRSPHGSVLLFLSILVIVARAHVSVCVCVLHQFQVLEHLNWRARSFRLCVFLQTIIQKDSSYFFLFLNSLAVPSLSCGFPSSAGCVLFVVQHLDSFHHYEYKAYIMCCLRIINYGNNTTKAHPKSITVVS